MKFIASILLILGCAWCGCRTYPSAEEHRRRLQVSLEVIVLNDGISASEADVIAQNYFLRYGPVGGSAARVTDGGEFWISSTSMGVGLPTREPIRIDKLIGRVTWSEGPTVDNPKTIW